MKTKLLLIVKLFLAAAVIVNLIMNIIILSSTQNMEIKLRNMSWDVEAIDRGVDSMQNDVDDIKDMVDDIRIDVNNISYYF